MKLEGLLASPKLHLFKADVGNKKEVEDVAIRIATTIGIPNVLINNAALDSPPSAPASENGPFEDYPLESIQKAFEVNVLGTVICCQVFGNDPWLLLLHVLVPFAGKVNHFKQCLPEFIRFQQVFYLDCPALK